MLTTMELAHLAAGAKTEERLTSLLAQGAAESVQPQLRSFFAHLAKRNAVRLQEISDVAEKYAESAFGAQGAQGAFSVRRPGL